MNYKKSIRALFFFLILLPTLEIASQTTTKTLSAEKIGIPIKIDGVLDESAWKSAQVATDFFQYEPYNGRKPSQPSQIKVLYDNWGIYVGAMLYDSSPDSILRELGIRDAENMNADEFTVDILTYNDGQNALEFRISASGVQGDTKFSSDFRDKSWDAVWKSAVNITDSGWIAEIEIPYSSLRFTKEETQVWGLNFWRGIKRYREWNTWNYVNNKLDGVLMQSGRLADLNNIVPPLRLSFVPYVAGYVEKMPNTKSWAYSYNYGLDLKLGLSESFTFDATLIPDFGQVQSDDVILNLSPFETYYDEKRSFFTEGMELFEKGGVFYTRRMGGTPSGYEDIQEDIDYKVIDNPHEIQLINASKISGRTRSGLGIGVFNAVTSNTFAKVEDSLGNISRKMTEPSTNYNMLVLDQSLKNNSYISLYNTNVYRGLENSTAQDSDSTFDNNISNVTGTEFRLTDNNDMFSVFGRINISQQYNQVNKPEFGHKYFVELGKISGNFRAEVYQNVVSDTYDHNDLGFLSHNNEFENGFNIEYNFYDPFWKLIKWENEFEVNISYLYAPRVYSSLDIQLNTRATFKNYLTIGVDLEAEPLEVHDHFESRTPGRVVIYPSNYELGIFLSPDYRKKFVIDVSAGIWKSTDFNQLSYYFGFKPRFRINDQIFLIYNFNYYNIFNDIGYVADSTNNSEQIIIMGSRNIQRVTNTLDVSYIFSPKASLTFRMRQYWVTVKYNEYFDLQEDGYMVKNNYSEDNDISFNAFNIDLIFTWEFAPGSEFLLIYKNNIDQESHNIPDDFFNNLNNTLNSPMANSFSIKVLYYLDYQYLKKRKRKPSS